MVSERSALKPIVQLARLLFVFFAVTFLTACVSLHRISVPADLALSIEPIGMEHIRTWADGGPNTRDGLGRIHSVSLQKKPKSGEQSNAPIPFAILALSGGGNSGAFGAGLLNGWSDAGDRPEFQMVTGVSAGALIAPFAFLGPDYDDQLEAFATTTNSDDVFDFPLIPNFLKGQSLGHSDPLARQIEATITQTVLTEIAKAHESGRRLKIVTTNLDAGRAVVWDMGAIAAIGGPDAADLFRKVMLASASIPGLMPPVQIEVGLTGKSYTELHADGGIIANVFAYNSQLQIENILGRSRRDIEPTLYVIRNGRMGTLYDPPKPIWYNLMKRSMDLMLTTSTNAEIENIYQFARRDGLKFRLAAIPDDYLGKSDGFFDKAYMQTLFTFAEGSARAGYDWQNTYKTLSSNGLNAPKGK